MPGKTDASLQFDYFDRFTPTYDEKRIEFVVDDLRERDVSAASLMDLGCGDGALLDYLRAQVPLARLCGMHRSALRGCLVLCNVHGVTRRIASRSIVCRGV